MKLDRQNPVDRIVKSRLVNGGDAGEVFAVNSVLDFSVLLSCSPLCTGCPERQHNGK